MLPGIAVRTLTKVPDDRGFFMEALRADWRDLLGDDLVVQANLSLSHPGVVRAWHRHARGQVDYFLVLSGWMRICAFDDAEGSPTRGRLAEITSSGEVPQLVRVPGHYWHGTMALGAAPALAVYFTTRLYDRANPDEERRPWNDPTVPYDWQRPVHR